MKDTHTNLPPVPDEVGELALFNLDAEQELIGSVLINPDVLPGVKYLEPTDFYIHRNGWIWEAFLKMHKAGIDIDTTTLSNELELMGRLKPIGGSAYITKLLAGTATSLHAEERARIIKDFSVRREYVRMSQRIATMAYDGEVPLDDLQNEFTEMAETQKFTTQGSAVAAEEAALNLMQILVEGQPLGIPSGLPLLDKHIGGMPLGETILLVGDSTVGKTALSLQIAETVSLRGKRVLYISTESKGHTMVARRVCGIAGIEQKLLRSGQLNDVQRDRLQHEVREYMGRHSGTLFFDDVSNHVNVIERSVAQVQPDFIVVDYLGELMSSHENRTLGLLADFDRLKHIAKRRGAAQIVIHTISAEDSYAKDDDEKPNFNALGWAKDLRYKNDILLGLYPSTEVLTNPDEQKRMLWIMKDREGARHNSVRLKFNVKKQWYTDSIL